MKKAILDYVEKNHKSWKTKPVIIQEGIQDNLMLVFGEPATIVFSHMDSTGFTSRYENQLVLIGGPDIEDDMEVVGEDSMGAISCRIKVRDKQVYHNFQRAIDRGTNLIFKPDFSYEPPFIQSCYLDNRAGVFACLKLAETIKDGIIAFSTYEEHGGGAVPMLLQYSMARYTLKQALIADITWATEGVQLGKGVAISLRDRHIPRKSFLDKVSQLAVESKIPFQFEVEGGGSSDGREVQLSQWPLDWCFVGAAEENVHSPDEKLHEQDLLNMIMMLDYLIARL